MVWKREKNRILVVDDDKSILASSKAILEAEGYIVDTVETGRKAIDKSKTTFYNLALLDIRLPDIEGTELLNRIHQGIPRTRMIMITGYPSLENVVEAMNQGAEAYIVKPIDPRKLLKLVKEKLEKQEVEEYKTVIPKHL